MKKPKIVSRPHLIKSTTNTIISFTNTTIQTTQTLQLSTKNCTTLKTTIRLGFLNNRKSELWATTSGATSPKSGTWPPTLNLTKTMNSTWKTLVYPWKGVNSWESQGVSWSRASNCKNFPKKWKPSAMTHKDWLGTRLVKLRPKSTLSWWDKCSYAQRRSLTV